MQQKQARIQAMGAETQIRKKLPKWTARRPAALLPMISMTAEARVLALKPTQSCAPFQDLFNLGYQSAAVGYCFGENGDHMATPDIPDIATRDAMAATGEEIICKMVERMNMPHVVEQLRKLEEYGLENESKYPWMPAAWNRNR